MKTLGHNVAEILRGWTDGVKDAGEITGRIILWFVAFLFGFHCNDFRFTLIEILYGDDLGVCRTTRFGGHTAATTFDREG